MSLSIRKLSTADLQAVIELMAASDLANLAPLGTSWSADQLKSECDEQLGWVAIDEAKRLVAFVFIRDLNVAWEVSLLATHPEHRGAGIMRRLLSHVLEQKPIDREFWLEVHEHNNPARRLYENMGLKAVGKRPAYYADRAAAILYNYG